MGEEYGGDFISITDEDGNEFELEHLDTIEYNGQTYMAFFPAVEEEKEVEDIDLDEEYGLIILKVVEENGEEQLSTLDSEEELELVYQQFMDALFDEEEGGTEYAAAPCAPPRRTSNQSSRPSPSHSGGMFAAVCMPLRIRPARCFRRTMSLTPARCVMDLI